MKDRKEGFRSSRHCGNVYNWLSHGIVGNSVCRTWESHPLAFPCAVNRVIHDSIACYAHFHNACLWFLWFGIMWCWRSISCFRLLASLPYMSIRAGVVVAVALHEIDNAPNAKTSPKSDNKCLQNAYCRSKKCHDKILSAACAAVRQADKRRSAISRRRIKKPPCIKAVSPRCVTSAARRYSVVRVWAVRCPVGARIR